jgi:hypothetical protein
MKNRGIIVLIGFLLAGTGFLALVLSLVGVQLAFLTWIDAFGGLIGFLIRVLMIMFGAIIIYVSRTNLEGENL